MKVIHARNVCAALPLGLTHLLEHGETRDSRAGKVLVAPTPVTTVYERPRERVLFSRVRDANPFFHLYEAAWMLCGRRDAASLTLFVRDFASRFAEPDGRIHDAYGWRWRHAMGFDQLRAIASRLRASHDDRQCVLQMWDSMSMFEEGSHDFPCSEDHKMYHGQDDLCDPNLKTRPCNVVAHFQVRRSTAIGASEDVIPLLDMTVFCRSNDMILGGYGANAVHFSVLQEYLAAMIGVDVGRYYQISNNCHVYESEVTRLYERNDLAEFVDDDRYSARAVGSRALVDDPSTFDRELEQVMDWHRSLTVGDQKLPAPTAEFANGFLRQTLAQMLLVHHHWRVGQKYTARTLADDIEADDWRVACIEWMNRRKK